MGDRACGDRDLVTVKAILKIVRIVELHQQRSNLDAFKFSFRKIVTVEDE